MPLNPTDNELDRRTIRRIQNLEERVRDLFTAQQQFVTLLQSQEIMAAISTQLEAIEITITSLENRIGILEDLPDIDA